MFPKRQKLNHAQVESRSQSDKPGEDFEQTFEESNHNEAVLSENAKDVSVQEKPISTQLESVPEEDADEFIERLLRQAEENLSSKTNEKQLTFPNVKLNPGSLPKPYFEITKKGNKLLTEHLEDSVIVTANNTIIKRLDPPISKSQKDKVSPLFFDFPFNDDIFLLFGVISRNVVLTSYCPDEFPFFVIVTLRTIHPLLIFTSLNKKLIQDTRSNGRR